MDNQIIDTDCVVIEDPFHLGAGPSRNRGVLETTTPWVGFCDDDDELDENYASWLYEIVHVVDPDLVIFRMKNQPNGGIPYTTDVNDLTYNQVGISFAMKTELARHFPFKNMQGEDYNLIMRLKKAGHFIYISNHIAYYLHGRGGTN